MLAARIVEADLLVGIRRQTLGALTFSSNWVEIAADADYFSETTPQLFAMLWSLAVEEQFYLVWPLVVLGLVAVTRSPTVRFRLVLAAAALSAASMAIRVDPGATATRVYYGTDTHVFGLMLGAAVAIAMTSALGWFARPRWWRVRRWLGVASVVAIVGLGLVLRSSSAITYRGGLASAPLAAAALVASVPGPPSMLSRAFSAGPLRWVGRRSYGIYLWDWPVSLVVMAAHGELFGAEPGRAVAATVVAVTLALAALRGR